MQLRRSSAELLHATARARVENKTRYAFARLEQSDSGQRFTRDLKLCKALFPPAAAPPRQTYRKSRTMDKAAGAGCPKASKKPGERDRTVARRAGGRRLHPGLLRPGCVGLRGRRGEGRIPRARSHRWACPRGTRRAHARQAACPDSGQRTADRHGPPSAPPAEPVPPAARRAEGAGAMPRGAGAARREGKGFSRDWARFPVL